MMNEDSLELVDKYSFREAVSCKLDSLGVV